MRIARREVRNGRDRRSRIFTCQKGGLLFTTPFSLAFCGCALMCVCVCVHLLLLCVHNICISHQYSNPVTFLYHKTMLLMKGRGLAEAAAVMGCGGDSDGNKGNSEVEKALAHALTSRTLHTMAPGGKVKLREALVNLCISFSFLHPCAPSLGSCPAFW